MTEPPLILHRLREALQEEEPLREVSMFGARVILVRDKIVVGVRKGRGLLLRVDPARDAELLARPGASPAEMGAGREMGPGWIDVAEDAVEGDAELAEWIADALEYNRIVTQA